MAQCWLRNIFLLAESKDRITLGSLLLYFDLGISVKMKVLSGTPDDQRDHF